MTIESTLRFARGMVDEAIKNGGNKKRLVFRMSGDVARQLEESIYNRKLPPGAKCKLAELYGIRVEVNDLCPRGNIYLMEE